MSLFFCLIDVKHLNHSCAEQGSEVESQKCVTGKQLCSEIAQELLEK